MNRRAVVLLSGGLDSATVLAVARDEGLECHALSLDYGQRHHAELDAARRVAARLGAAAHRIMRLDMGAYAGSALTDASIAVPESPTQGIPVTYVPARNTIMLALALGWAEVLDADAIYIGVNALDYSGYPDCRPAFVEAFQALADLATKRALDGHPIHIKAPLIDLSKADIIRMGARLGRGLRPHRVLLPGQRIRPRLRALRFLPASPPGLRAGGYPGPHALFESTDCASHDGNE
jgi:7-cyano-7-deazaguanine synthase